MPETDIGSDGTILTGLVSWLDHRNPGCSHAVTGQSSPAVGYSSRTLLVDIARAVDGEVHEERIVLKLPPVGPAIFDRYDFAMQAVVQDAVDPLRIPTASPATAESEDRWMGAPFLVMPLVDGHIISATPAFDPLLSEADPPVNEAFHRRFLDLMANINRIDWRSAGLERVVPRRDNAAELAYWRDYLDWYGDGEELAPTLTAALAWCASNQPDREPPPSLLWGDVRIENLILDDELVPRAVLDWEMATIGAAEHDLAWMLSLDATQEALMQRTVPGFLNHDACVARYEESLGRPVENLVWYEVFASVRSTAIMSRISYLNDQRGEANFFPIADNPILDLLRDRIDRASG